jgi:hypothetical protein
LGYIGIDVAVAEAPGSVVDLQKGSFTNCLVTFNPSFVNKTT